MLAIWVLIIINEGYAVAAILISSIHCGILAFQQRKRIESFQQRKRVYKLEQASKRNFEEQRLAKLKKFRERQKAKGLVKFGKKWGTPEKVRRWKEIKL